MNQSLDWLTIRNKYLLFDEAHPKRALKEQDIKKLIAKDNDYRIFLKGKYGEIYRFSNDGTKIGVYLRAGKSGLKRSNLNALGARYTQVGDNEFALILASQTLHLTAKIVGIFRSHRKTGLL